MNIEEIKEGLEKVNYIPNNDILFAVSGAINSNIPLLIEGSPGTGKTLLAKAVSQMLDIPLIRVQFYEGITADKILYDYDYQKQLLTIESIKSVLSKELGDKKIKDAVNFASKINFYDETFLIKRPILQSITSDTPCVLLLDEVEKSSEEIEYALLEFLDEFALTIPQLGRIEAKNKPIVFLTSNNYRQLSDALKRRCNYLYIEDKTENEMKKILETKAQIDEKLSASISKMIVSLRNLNLKQMPSIAEAINWGKYLTENEIKEEDIPYTLGILLKNKEDIEIAKKGKILNA